MIKYEIDWRIGPLHAVIIGIEAGLKAIQERIDKEPGFDGLFALEYTDPLLGLGFVAAQTYVLGACRDLNRLRKHDGHKKDLKPDQCRASDPITVKPGVNRIQLVHAIANYFKHHDEWSEWGLGRSAKTTQVLGRVGITKTTNFPCVEATRLLCGESWDIMVLHRIVREWRAHIFSASP